MRETGMLPLPVIDAVALETPRRSLLQPDEVVLDREGRPRRLPRYFYEVDSWQTALHMQVAEHFTLSEFMGVDVREARSMRVFPRYVPCSVTLLAAHLELLRQAVGTYVYIAANGAYRSPSHGLVDYASTHCWGTAANIYRVGDDYLDSSERIERFVRTTMRVLPGVWIRPYGQEKGFADDHVHLDIGYVRFTPRSGSDEEK
jgi:hypothetical protein